MAEHGLSSTFAASVAATVKVRARMPMKGSLGEIIYFDGLIDGMPHVAVVYGDALAQKTPLVRVHSKCLTGDVFDSQRCDCGEQLEIAKKRMRKRGGIILYMEQEGRGIGLEAKLRAYNLQDQGRDTVEANIDLGHPADARTYEPAAQMLHALHKTRIRILTNNPDKREQLEKYGIEIETREPLQVKSNPNNHDYLETKFIKMRHIRPSQK